MTRTLRIAVLLDEERPPAWIARILTDIATSTIAKLVLVVRRGRPVATKLPPLARLYDALDKRINTVPLDPLAPTDVGESLRDVPVIVVESSEDSVRDDLPADLLAGSELDVVLKLGFRGLSDAILAIPRFGVWTYRDVHGLAGFWEVIEGAPVTTCSLERLVAGGPARVLYRSWSRTDPWSARRNRANTYWKASAFVKRVLEQLAASNELADAPSLSEPKPQHQLAAFAGLGRRVVRDRLERARGAKQWRLAFGIDPSLTGHTPTLDLAKLTPIVPSPDRFWADPFVAKHGDGWVVFFEEKLYAERKATIAALEIDRHGNIGEAFPVLDCPYHLSYPFIFNWSSTWWMIPESARNNTVDLWRATEFPRRWVREKTLLSLPAADATLLEYQQRWWMFCNLAEPGASKDDELSLFHADNPLGPWVSHRRNPIKSDVRSARPAGRLFVANGQLHRPAQDGSDGYGAAIVLHRVTRLDTEAFAEERITRLAPDWRDGLVGLHTINAADGLTVIDFRQARASD